MGPTTVQGCHQTNASTTSPQRATHLRQQPPRQHQHRHLPQTPPTAHIESLFIPKQRRTGNVTTQADYNPPPPLQPENGATVACRGQACSEGRYVGGGGPRVQQRTEQAGNKAPLPMGGAQQQNVTVVFIPSHYVADQNHSKCPQQCLYNLQETCEAPLTEACLPIAVSPTRTLTT